MVNWVLLMQILLCLYFLQILDFLVTDLVYTGTDLVINFDLVKCITKANTSSYPDYNGKVDGGLSSERQNLCISKMYFHGVFKRH